jgi:hypothetical protein
MVFNATFDAISVISWRSWIYNYLCNQCLSPLKFWVRAPLWQSVLDTTLCDKVCQWLTAGRWFSPWTLVSSINKTAYHDIPAILMKVTLNTINQTDWKWINGFLLSFSSKYKEGQHLGKTSLRNRYMFNMASSHVLIVLLILVPRNSLTTQYCLSIGCFFLFWPRLRNIGSTL